MRRAVDQEKLDVKKNPTMKLSGLFVETMDKVETMLGSDLPIRGGTWTTPEVEMIKEKLPQLITTKPIVYLVNLNKKDFVRKRNKWLVKIHEWIKSHGGGVMIPFSVEFEQELWDLRADEEAQKAFLDGAEGAKSALPRWWFRCATHPTPGQAANVVSFFPMRRPASDSTRSLTLLFSSPRLSGI